MNKKLCIGCILAVFMLVAVSFSSAVGRDTDVEKKESPLFRIRTRVAIGEKISNIIINIRDKLFEERIIFLPIKLLKDIDYSRSTTAWPTDCTHTCKSSGCPTFLALCTK